MVHHEQTPAEVVERVLSSEPMLTDAQVTEQYGLNSSEMIARGSLFALDHHAMGRVFPAFQFDHDGPRAELELVLRPLVSSELSQEVVCAWFFTTHPDLEDRSPAVVMGSQPAAVLEAAHALARTALVTERVPVEQRRTFD